MSRFLNSESSIVDRMYEASFIPELWPEVCDLIAARAGGCSGAVSATDTINQTMRWVSSDRVRGEFQRYAVSDFRFENVRIERHLAMRPFSFIRDTDMMTEEEVSADPIVRMFLEPLGLRWMCGDVMLEPSGHMVVVDFLRQTDNGPFRDSDVQLLNAMKPDLSRATLMSSRLAFNEAVTIAKALSSVGLATAVVGDRRNVIATNPEMDACSPRIRIGARDGIGLADAKANALLAVALQAVAMQRPNPVQSIPIAADDENSAMIVHVLPVRRNARDIFSRSIALVIATQIGAVNPPDLQVLAGLFDLTPGQAKVAQGMASGLSTEEISRKLGVTVHTVRAYLKQIFSKTGVTRQAELVALLSGVSLNRLN